MSLRVLVIPEDPTHNGYILKPLAEAILADVGKPRAQIQILVSPRLRGFDHALREIRGNLATRYGHWDLWLFFPDADRATERQMRDLEHELARQSVTLLACPAVPEVEIYACTPWLKELDLAWEEARKHPRFKEEVFGPLLARRGDPNRAGGGREQMIEQSLRNLPLLLRLCPELADLRARLETVLSAR